MLGLGLGLNKSSGKKSKNIAKDSFNRANSTTTLGTAETGQSYLLHGVGVWGVNTNRAYLATQDFATYNAALIETGKANVSVEVDVIYMTDTGGGLCFRESNDTNFYQAVISSAGAVLRKLVNNVYADLGSYSFVPVNATSYKLKVVANGDSIKVYIDGTERISVTDTFNNTATKHGLRVATNTIYLDNLLIERVG